MEISDWISYHDIRAEKRCGVADSTLHPCINGESILWTDEKYGAVQFVIRNDTMFITGMVGNFKYWENILLQFCNDYGIKRVIGYTCSNKPKAVARLMGMEVKRTWYELEREV